MLSVKRSGGVGLLGSSIVGTALTALKKNLPKRDGSVPNLSKPRYFFYEIIDHCNSKCQSCNIWMRPPSKDYLTKDDITKLFSTGFFSEVEDIIVSGGEPIMHKEITEALIEISKHVKPGCRFNFSTNGLLPEKVFECVKKLDDAGLEVIVGISLEGVGKQHDDVRGVPGNFKKVDRLVDYLVKYRDERPKRKHGFGIGIGSLMMKDNQKQVKDVYEYCKSKNIDYNFQMYEEWTYYSSYNKKDEDSALNNDTRFGNSLKSDSIIKDDYSTFEFLGDDNDKSQMLKSLKYIPGRLQKQILERSLNNDPLKFKCGAMTNFFLLHDNGDISPCLKFANIRTGNIRDEDPFKVWNSEKSKEAREMVANCRGCSNTWSTSWSLNHWLFPFLGDIFKSRLRKT